MLERLDPGDKHYDRKYQDMQERMDNLYDRIAELEEAITDVETKIGASYGKQVTGKKMYQFLLDIDILYGKMTDLEKKEFMRTFIESIELDPDEKDMGRIIKHRYYKYCDYSRLYSSCCGQDSLRNLQESGTLEADRRYVGRTFRRYLLNRSRSRIRTCAVLGKQCYQQQRRTDYFAIKFLDKA